MDTSESWLDRVSDAGRRELVDLIAQFLAQHRRLAEQTQLARLEADVLSGTEPGDVATFLTAHALHAARAAELQLTVGDIAARMASVIQREVTAAGE